MRPIQARLAAIVIYTILLSGCTAMTSHQSSPAGTNDDLFRKPAGVVTRWASFENPTTEPGRGGMENDGAKGHAFDSVQPGEVKTLMDVTGSGTIRRIWMTLNPQDAKMLRSLRLDMYWDGAEKPAVSVPLGDFFGVAVGVRIPFENALMSSPEAKSLVCTIPMPFRSAARVTLTNQSDRRLKYLFYDIDFTQGDRHDDSLYFHANWRRERWTTLGRDFEILPRVEGEGRFLGSSIGVMVKPGNAGWWGEGEVKVYLDGDSKWPTLVGTGLEDYVGAAWGLGTFINDYQGCPVADGKAGLYAFYRYHLADPIYFDDDCRVTIQQIGGGARQVIRDMLSAGVEIEPITVDCSGSDFYRLLEMDPAPDVNDPDFPDGWVNFYRSDDYSATAFFYLDSPTSNLPALAPIQERIEGLE